jgi:hypothetical protein
MQSFESEHMCPLLRDCCGDLNWWCSPDPFPATGVLAATISLLSQVRDYWEPQELHDLGTASSQ